MEIPLSCRRFPRASLVVLAAIAVVYLFTFTENHTEAEDSLHYLTVIERGQPRDLFTRDHLLYLGLNRVFLDAWRAFGYSGHAELPVRLLNVLASIASLALVLVILRSLAVPFHLALLSAVSVAFSYAYWLYTGQCETYIMPIPFILGCIYGLGRAFETPSRTANHILVGILSAAAILIHRQHSVLTVVVVAAYGLLALTRRESLPFRLLVRTLAVYLGVCAGTVLGVYALVGTVVLEQRSLGGFLAWILGQDFAGVGRVGVASLAMAGAGLSRAIVSTHYLFVIPQAAAALGRLFPGKSLREETFLVRNLPQWMSLALAAMTLVLAVCIITALVEIARRRSCRVPYAQAPRQPAAVYGYRVVILYIVAYSLFNVWWEPVNPEFWISVLPALGILCALVACGAFAGRLMKTALTGAAVLIFAVNLLSGIVPQRNPANDYWLASTEWLRGNSGRGDLVVTGAGYLAKGYIEYYSGADVFDAALPLPEQDLWDRYLKTIDRVRPRRVLVSSTLLNPNPEYLHQFGAHGAGSAAVFERMRPFLTDVHSGVGETVYVYRGPTD